MLFLGAYVLKVWVKVLSRICHPLRWKWSSALMWIIVAWIEGSNADISIWLYCGTESIVYIVKYGEVFQSTKLPWVIWKFAPEVSHLKNNAKIRGWICPPGGQAPSTGGGRDPRPRQESEVAQAMSTGGGWGGNCKKTCELYHSIAGYILHNMRMYGTSCNELRDDLVLFWEIFYL